MSVHKPSANPSQVNNVGQQALQDQTGFKSIAHNLLYQIVDENTGLICSVMYDSIKHSATAAFNFSSD